MWECVCVCGGEGKGWEMYLSCVCFLMHTSCMHWSLISPYTSHKKVTSSFLPFSFFSRYLNLIFLFFFLFSCDFLIFLNSFRHAHQVPSSLIWVFSTFDKISLFFLFFYQDKKVKKLKNKKIFSEYHLEIKKYFPVFLISRNNHKIFSNFLDIKEQSQNIFQFS